MQNNANTFEPRDLVMTKDCRLAVVLDADPESPVAKSAKRLHVIKPGWTLLDPCFGINVEEHPINELTLIASRNPKAVLRSAVKAMSASDLLCLIKEVTQ